MYNDEMVNEGITGKFNNENECLCNHNSLHSSFLVDLLVSVVGMEFCFREPYSTVTITITTCKMEMFTELNKTTLTLGEGFHDCVGGCFLMESFPFSLPLYDPLSIHPA